MANPKRSFAELISRTQIMVSALTANAEQMAKRGIDTGFVTKLEALRSEAKKLNDEQEELKADLKTKTDVLNSTMDEMDNMYMEAKKLVKIEIQQTQWKEFGIEDSR